MGDIRVQFSTRGRGLRFASKSFLANDMLLGIETLGPPISLSRKFTVRPASKQERKLIRALATCPVPKRAK